MPVYAEIADASAAGETGGRRASRRRDARLFCKFVRVDRSTRRLHGEVAAVAAPAPVLPPVPVPIGPTSVVISGVTLLSI